MNDPRMKALLEPEMQRSAAEHGALLRGLVVPMLAAVALAIAAVLLAACGGSLQQHAPTVIRGTLGGLYGACQTVDSDDATWRRICDGVERALPHLGQLGAGPAELPPDVAEREVTITIGGEP